MKKNKSKKESVFLMMRARRIYITHGKLSMVYDTHLYNKTCTCKNKRIGLQGKPNIEM